VDAAPQAREALRELPAGGLRGARWQAARWLRAEERQAAVRRVEAQLWERAGEGELREAGPDRWSVSACPQEAGRLPLETQARWPRAAQWLRLRGARAG